MRPTTPTTTTTSALAQSRNNIDDDDPTKVWYAGLADSIQKVLSNNPLLKEAKQALVKSFAGDYDQAAVRAQLDGLIAEHPVLMLSFTTCPFCIKAKSILDAQQAKYHVVECDVDVNGKSLRPQLGRLYQWQVCRWMQRWWSQQRWTGAVE
jgi:Glutaredoxin